MEVLATGSGGPVSVRTFDASEAGAEAVLMGANAASGEEPEPFRSACRGAGG